MPPLAVGAVAGGAVLVTGGVGAVGCGGVGAGEFAAGGGVGLVTRGADRGEVIVGLGVVAETIACERA
jgi:hypothetical protein